MHEARGIDISSKRGPSVISAEEIAANRLPVSQVNQLVRDVLAQYARGHALGALKAEVRAPDGSYHQALPSLLIDREIACLKWVSVPGASANAPITGTILLSDMTSGELIGILDASSITATRTAAMSAVAADMLSRPNSTRIGLVGAGAQARSHIEALMDVRPTVESVTIYSRTEKSSAALADFAERLGLTAQVVRDPRQAVAEQDIVVTTVPASGVGGLELDGRWLSAGSFVTMPDLGRGWIAASLESIEYWATDNIEQMKAIVDQGKCPVRTQFDADLPTLAAASAHPSIDADDRRGFVFGGMGICDAAVAVAYLDRLRPQS